MVDGVTTIGEISDSVDGLRIFDQAIADRHVTVAWGRDYGDVSPVKGIIFTKVKRSTLRVSVDVAPRDDA